MRKAHRLTARDVEILEKAGISEIIAAVLDTGDLDENEAATRLAQALETSNAAARPASTGGSIFMPRRRASSPSTRR